jgi:myo-inositol-hexaphosphate 3-phosphohydrolase
MKMQTQRRWLALVSCVCCGLSSAAHAQFDVPAGRETVPVPSGGDAADDPAIWVHPTDRDLSVVIGTDKDAGLAVYDLAGNQLQFLPHGSINNVDLRQGFRLGGKLVTLVTADERDQDVLVIYVLDPTTRQLHDVAARVIPFGFDVYGACMYRSAITNETYFIGTSEDGAVQQWRLFDAGAGRVDAALVRTLDLGSTTEGCVADDEAGFLFFSEEDAGIWRYGAEPTAGTARILVDGTGPGGNLTSDVEGLGLYDARGGAGYLIASSQGNDSFVVYDRRPPHAYRASFRVSANPALGIDAVGGTDGIDVMSRGLGAAFPDGLFVCQDGDNPGANQNFKFVSWSEIASRATPPLLIDPPDDVGGTACLQASARVRNGGSVNPLVLQAGPPRLGQPWSSTLDCTGHGPGNGVLFGYSRAATGPTVLAGELLVDLASPRFFLLLQPHAGGAVSFQIQVPPESGLCGLAASVQGLCTGAPADRLSNAVDLRFGL